MRTFMLVNGEILEVEIKFSAQQLREDAKRLRLLNSSSAKDRIEIAALPTTPVELAMIYEKQAEMIESVTTNN